jgi:hypothetical protein
MIGAFSSGTEIQSQRAGYERRSHARSTDGRVPIG